MVENAITSNTTDPISMAFEVQNSIFHMQTIWLSLLLGASGNSIFIDDYKNVLKNSQSRGVRRNRRSYDQIDFGIFNMAPTLCLDFFNEIYKLYVPEKNSMTLLEKSP